MFSFKGHNVPNRLELYLLKDAVIRWADENAFCQTNVCLKHICFLNFVRILILTCFRHHVFMFCYFVPVRGSNALLIFGHARIPQVRKL